MKTITFIGTAALAASLSGCVVAPIGPVGPVAYGAPAGAVYIAPIGVAPGPGWGWAYRPYYGWGWHHARYGWR